MKYIERHVEKVVVKASKSFSAVMISGSRQVGKTTLLKHLLSKKVSYVSLDDPTVLLSAKEEPGLFFKQYKPPVIVDETQYAPELFPYIKLIADNSGATGQFYLTGSQAFHLMKNVSESLAGRIGIINLSGLSLREIKGKKFYKPFVPEPPFFSQQKKHSEGLDFSDLFSVIHRGTMPALQKKDMDWQLFYSSYVKTYIERDVRSLSQIGNELSFLKFMTVVAARTGQMLNYSDIAKDAAVSPPTAERWLSVLISSGIVYLMRPYFNYITKRAIKTPKLYFLDTGLAAYLTKWNNQEVLQYGAMAGAFFETFVVSEILKSYFNTGVIAPPLYYYRDKDMREIDVIIEENGVLYPLEIKKTANPSKNDISAFSVLDKIHGKTRGTGGIICMHDNLLPLDRKNLVIPVRYL